MEWQERRSTFFVDQRIVGIGLEASALEWRIFRRDRVSPISARSFRLGRRDEQSPTGGRILHDPGTRPKKRIEYRRQKWKDPKGLLFSQRPLLRDQY